MSIDWITVVAQIANFLVLVWLLKRFLYRPILAGIDAREAEIARRMCSADEARRKADVAAAEYNSQQEKLVAMQEKMVEQALQESVSERERLLADAHSKVEEEISAWHKQQARESQQFATALRRAGAETLLALTRKALYDLADQTLEEAIVGHLVMELQSVATDLDKAAGDSTDAIAITREPLSTLAREKLRKEVDRYLPGTVLTFETDSQQAPGVILRIGGARVSWTIDSYIDELNALLYERMAVRASTRLRSDVS